MKTTLFAAAAIAATASAQVTGNPDGTFSCTKADTAFCAGDSLSSNIILRCNGTVAQPGNCNDNLAGIPPVGVKTAALCWQSSPDAGDAGCSFNGTVYSDSGKTFPIPSGTPSSSSAAASGSASGSASGYPNPTGSAEPSASASASPSESAIASGSPLPISNSTASGTGAPYPTASSGSSSGGSSSGGSYSGGSSSGGSSSGGSSSGSNSTASGTAGSPTLPTPSAHSSTSGAGRLVANVVLSIAGVAAFFML